MNICETEIYKDDISYIAGLSIPWEKLYGKTILITGASGLIGGLIIDSIIKHKTLYGCEIKLILMSRNEERIKIRFAKHWANLSLHFIKHDVNYPLPELGNIDFIIHAASNTHPIAYASDPIGTITTNVIGTYNLLQYAVDHGKPKFVFISTVEIYGENTSNIERFKENDMGYIDCNTLRSGYPESKRVSEAMCNAYALKYGIKMVIPRLCRIYGPSLSESDSKALSQFIFDAVSGRDIVLKSNGEQRFSFCYSVDAVAAILFIMLLGKTGQAYNVADPKSDITLKELAEELALISGKRVVYELPDEVESSGFSRVTKAMLDSDKLKGLGWAARDDIQSGLRKTIKVLAKEKRC